MTAFAVRGSLRPAVALTGLLVLLAVGWNPLPGNGSLVVAGVPTLLADTDKDGLSDAFELYLSSASNAPEHACSPLDGDSDNDGQPDGFEYCLSDGASVVSPGVVYPVEPKVTLASHQDGNDLLVSILMTFTDVKDLKSFKLYIAAPQPSGPVVTDISSLLVPGVESIGLASSGPYLLGVMQIRVPLSLISKNGSLALAAVANIAGASVGDAATYTVADGVAYRWRFYTHALAQAQGGSESGAQTAGGTAEPQKTDVLPGAAANQVCGTEDVEEPSSNSSVLTRIAVKVGCKGGTWSCVGSVCSKTGSAGQPKVVLDVNKLLN